MPQLLEVLRFQREDLAETPPLVISGRAYGDYPFRTDPGLAIPADVYRLRQELTLTARLDELRLDGDRVHLRGWSFIDGIGAPAPGSQRLGLVAVPRGPLRRLRYVLSGIRLRTRQTLRPEATAIDGRLCDASWSGFEATLDLKRLRTAGRWRDGTWDLFVVVRSGRERRRRVRWFLDGPRPLEAVDLQADGGLLVRASTAETGEVVFEVDTA